MKRTGTIIRFNEEKGFGFIAPDTETGDLFFHVSAISGDRTGLAAGEAVRFELGLDKQGRIQAKRVQRSVAKRWDRRVMDALLLVNLFFAAMAILAKLGHVSWWVPGTYALMSAISFSAYASDKSSARAGDRRTSEATLHMLDLLGGWPGGMLARQVFRHKSRKVSFRIDSGLIVAFHMLVWVLVLVVLPAWLPDVPWQGLIGPE